MCQAPLHSEPNITSEAVDNYLVSKTSPLAQHGQTFLDQGKYWRVDPRLVVAIAGAETTFGTRGECSKVFNAWNWFNNGPCPGSSFPSWDDGIRVVTKFMRISYLNDHKTTITLIRKKYCADQCDDWIRNVTLFYNVEQKGDTSDLGFNH